MSRDSRRSREYEEESGDEQHELEEDYRPRRRRQPVYDDYEYEFEPAPRQRRRRRRRRRVWPFLLLGCGGIICLIALFVGIAIVRFGPSISSNPNNGLGGLGIAPVNTYSKTENPPLPVGSLSSMNVHSQVGNVTVSVDPNATQAMVQTVKKVKASSQSQADQAFRNLGVKIQQDNTTGLTIDATVPTQNGTVFNNNNNDSIDMQITLPPAAQGGTTPFTLGINLSVGQVKVSGLSGLFTVSNDIGDVIVQGAALTPGSRITTANGNVTFSGTLNGNGSTTNVPAPTVTPDATPTPPASSQQIYTIKSEVGNLDITLPATDVNVDINTNSGKLSSDFQLAPPPTQDGNSVNFYGPLMPQTNPTQVLVAHVGTGNITLHHAS